MEKWVTLKNKNRVLIDDEIEIEDALGGHFKRKTKIKMAKSEMAIVRSELNTYCNIYRDDSFEVGGTYDKRIFISTSNKYYVYKFYIRDYNHYVIVNRRKVKDVER